MKPRNGSRSFGCPPILWLDDPEKLHHYLGRSAETIERWAEDGLRIHSKPRGERMYRYVLTDEFLAFLNASEKSHRALSEGSR